MTNNMIAQTKLSKDAKQKLDAYLQIEFEHMQLERSMLQYTMPSDKKRKYAEQIVEHAKLLMDASERLAELEKHG